MDNSELKKGESTNKFGGGEFVVLYSLASLINVKIRTIKTYCL